MHSVEETASTVKSRKTSGQGAAPSVVEDSTLIPVEEGLQQNEGAEPRMWSTVTGALSAWSDGDQEGATGPYIPSFSANGRSRDSVARNARAPGEAQFGDAESVDEWMTPSPILGVAAESVDRSTTPPPVFQSERNQLDVSPGSTDGKMTTARAELMETAELSEGSRGACPLVDGVLDTVEGHLQQITDSSEVGHLQQTTESFEAETAVVPAECTSARAVVYSNFKSVDPPIIIKNNKS